VDEVCTGKVTGGGEIEVPAGKANFGFVVMRRSFAATPAGNLEYVNHATGLNVHSVAIQTLQIWGGHAIFTGTCTKKVNGSPPNGTPCTYTVTVEDAGEPGRNVDRFTIEVSGEPIEGSAGPIIGGNIQVHTP